MIGIISYTREADWFLPKGGTMKIQDFTDMKKFQEIMENWATATGLATVAVDADGTYLSDCFNFTDFCMKYTRQSPEGKLRCEKCDRECSGVYRCHAGLIDFSIDLTLNGEKLGAVIGGQVLPEHPDEEKFREVARELSIDEDAYIDALQKVNVRSEAGIRAAAYLLGDALNNCILASYNEKYRNHLLENLGTGISTCETLVKKIEKNVEELNSIQQKQKILALNASIEAARAGEAGRGFTIVANEVENLSKSSSTLNGSISENVQKIAEVVQDLMNTQHMQ